jgi:uncharacterized protein YbjT (DUF2867 family)
MSHSAAKLKGLPEPALGVVANLEDPSTLAAAFQGVCKVFLVTALSPTETQQGLAAVTAASTAGVSQFVYMSVVRPVGSTHIPHYQSKIPIENALRASGMSYTILQPNNFYQNDFWFQEAILKYGVYPQPLGSLGVNRVDVRDIAEAAVNALLNSTFSGQTYTLNGPEALSGPEVAAIFSRQLGREIHYSGDDLERWEEQALSMLPSWLVLDLRIMYQYFLDHGLRASAIELAKQQSILGHAPRHFEAFAAEINSYWKNWYSNRL